MTRIDFYILPTSDPKERRVLACKLTEKAWRVGMKVFIHTASEAETAIMDNLLWTFRQGSFIPHEKSTASPAEQEDISVLIGHDSPALQMDGLLINLSLESPASFDRYQRLAELVDQDESVRQAGRERYRRYRTLGFDPQTHHLDAAADG